MQHKRAEALAREMMKHYQWYRHKYGDVRRCIHCDGLLPKTENAPDYSCGFVYTYIECKNSDAHGTWQWTEISPDGDRANQRNWLLREGGWLFIELGDGNAPKGRSAFLVPFDHWVEKIEPILIGAGMKSIRKEKTYRNRPGADDLLADYRLSWEGGKWIPPDNHVWWTTLHIRLQDELDKVDTHIHNH